MTMTELRKLITDGMGKSAAPEIPAHLRHATDAAKAAILAARTPAEKFEANRQGQQAFEALKAYRAGELRIGVFKSLQSEPLNLTKDFGK
jgi:hypothetical protein